MTGEGGGGREEEKGLEGGIKGRTGGKGEERERQKERRR